MYIGALVAVSLVARTFGTYAATLLPTGAPKMMVPIFAAAVVLIFMAINLGGARAMARAENLVVLVKMSVLVVFALVGLAYVAPERLSPQSYPPVSVIFYSVAITFFAYEGFRIVTNAAEDMEIPARTLPRAVMTSIGLVMIIYVALAIAVFGNLPPEKVVAAMDFALAEAARPIFGAVGFTIVAIAALFSTASAINASLYAVTNVTYELARKGELTNAFGQPFGHSREGLVISSAIIIVLAVFFDLSAIAEIGALSMLLVHITALFSYRGEDVVATLDQVCHRVGYPATIRVDQGSEFISRDMDLWAYQRSVTLDFSRPGKPTDNAFIEAFNGRFRAECLNSHWVMSLEDAAEKMEAWRRDYNEERPHSAIGNKVPAALMKPAHASSRCV